MIAISLRQPWAEAIFDPAYGKDVENRTHYWRARNVPVGDVVIHASLGTKELANHPFNPFVKKHGLPEMSDERREQLPRGCIVGVVRFTGIVLTPDSPLDAMNCSRWHMPGQWGYVIDNPRRFSEPIPYKGALGFFKVDPTRMSDEEYARISRVSVGPWAS